MNTELVEALELQNLLLQSIASVESALKRKESSAQKRDINLEMIKNG